MQDSYASLPTRRAGGLSAGRLVVQALCAAWVALMVPFVIAALRSAAGGPLARPLHIVLDRQPIIFPVHMAASACALALVPFAVASIRTPSLHRWIGRAAATAIAIGGLASLVVAPMSVATVPARAAFFCQGLVWLALAATGVWAILRKRRALHARLMTATAIVTVSPILLRLGMFYAVAHRLPFASTYAALAWLVWLVPLACYLGLCATCGASSSRGIPRQLEGTVHVAFPE